MNAKRQSAGINGIRGMRTCLPLYVPANIVASSNVKAIPDDAMAKMISPLERTDDKSRFKRQVLAVQPDASIKNNPPRLFPMA